jgi:hypothetical protein
MIEFPGLNLTAPDGCIIGVIEVGPPALHHPEVMRHTMSQMDSVQKSREVNRLLERRREGATIVLVSHDETLLENVADEIWWIDNGALVARGDPAEVLAKYRAKVAEILRQTGGNELHRLSPTMRRGDGRANLESLEISSAVLTSGEMATIRVTVKFAARVADPVIGIMIRTRVGLNVYGTNTELEGLRLGPVEAGETLRVTYSFNAALCPGQYTVTAASHDPDGVWHDWMEDAIAFAVTDSRYTAGVANLKAKVEAERL